MGSQAQNPKDSPAFLGAVTEEEHSSQKLNWLTETPVWVDQWLLSKQKLSALTQLVEEQLAKGNTLRQTALGIPQCS